MADVSGGRPNPEVPQWMSDCIDSYMRTEKRPPTTWELLVWKEADASCRMELMTGCSTPTPDEHHVSTAVDDAGISARCADHPNWFAWATGRPGLEPQIDEHVWSRPT